jgi:hypothetical protein
MRRIVLVDFDGDVLERAGLEVDLLPSSQAAGRFAGGGREAEIDLGNFCAGARPGIRQVEGHLKARIFRGQAVDKLCIRDRERGVGEPETEEEKRREALRVVPLVTDVETFGVGDRERRVLARRRLWGGAGQRRSLGT